MKTMLLMGLEAREEWAGEAQQRLSQAAQTRNTVIGDVDRTIAYIGPWAIELSRETPTAGMWIVTISGNGSIERRTFESGPAAAEFYRRQCEAALHLSIEERLATRVPEYEVDYLDGTGWKPVDEAHVRRVLANNYQDVEPVMETLEDGREVRTMFAQYRKAERIAA